MKKLSEYELIQECESSQSSEGDLGLRVNEFYKVPAAVAEAADAVIQAASDCYAHGYGRFDKNTLNKALAAYEEATR